MADAIVSVVVERLSDMLVQEGTSLYLVRDQVTELKKELIRIRCLLKDADERKSEDRATTRQWVAEIRDIAYDIEDTIETYALKVASKRGGGIQNFLKRLSSIFCKLKAVRQIRSEIAKITTEVSNLRNSLLSIGIKESGEGAGASSSSEKLREQRQTYPHIEHDVVGMEDNLIEVVAYLTKEKHNKVVSICGMGGLGKTTLARKVYHHQEVKSHFNCRAWAYISQQCQRRDVWEGVMIGLITSPSREQREEIRSLRDEELAEKLCEFQRQNKCLVVLDDIWHVKDWNSLRAAFPMNDTNSRILLTSRIEDLALHVDPRGLLHKLKFLNDENSRELLQKLAISWRKDSKIKEDMSFLGKEMVRYCKGLPLAVIVLGGLLATKQTLEEWEQVHRNVKSYLHQQEDLQINTVLALSYDDLPSHLKLCFLYLGHFPEDFEIRTKELIQMWMAEGLILQMQHTGSNEETLEDVGERHLQELVQRCMVQVGQKSSVAGIKTCRLHDLMRDFCMEKAKLENFLSVININDESNEEIEAPIGKVRRVAISGGSNLVTVSRSQKYFHLRSLLTFSVPLKDQLSVLRNFKYLRVLNFVMNTDREGSGVVDFPPEINSLIHLRFLSLRYIDVTSIPSLGNLKCLQTLDLRSTYDYNVINVPNDVFRNMEHLRHLFLPRFLKVSGKLQLPNASKLQTLVNILVFICDVKDPTAGFDEFGMNLMPSNFTFNCLHVLKIFTIQDRRDHKRVDITPMVMSCPHIYQLRLWGEIEKLPEHDKISPRLVQLKLIKTCLKEDLMLTLEKLPNLKILHLRINAYTGKKMICSVRGFPQLQSLILTYLDFLEEWEVEEGSLPSLCHLKIERCDNLRMVPDGLQFVTTLQKLEIIRMPMSFTDGLGEGGQDFYKIRHVPSLQILPKGDR